MLGNNADQFFQTPMRTSVLAGGNAAFASGGGMPAPYGAVQRDFLPGVGEGEAAPTTAGKVLGMTVPVAIAAGVAAFLFLTPPGAKLRRKLGF